MHVHTGGPFPPDEPRREHHAVANGPAPRRATARPVRVEYEPALDRTDLRRRVRREAVETILHRAVWIDPSDRVLVEAVYRDHRTVADLARLLGTDDRSLRRRVRRIVQRLLSPQFVFVASSMARSATSRRPSSPASPPPGPWSDTRRRVAEHCVLNGRSLRDAARALNLSLHVVRRHRDALHACFEMERDGRCP